MKKQRSLLLSAVLAAVTLAAAPTARAFDPTSQTDIMTVLVVGATGQQGGAVAREWLRRGYAVRGLTRNPSGPRSRVLSAAGAQMVRGNLNDPTSLARALDGVDGVFLMTDFWEHGYDGEVRHGRHMIEAAEAAGVKHLVYSSVASADRGTGIPHFDSKYDVERLLAASSLSWTVIRPVSFMENWRRIPEDVAGGVYETPLRPGATLQYVSVEDIGRFTAMALEDPEAWRGRALDIAASSVTVEELRALFASTLGRPVVLKPVSWSDYEARAGAEMTVMMRWFDGTGYDVDVPALRAGYPWMMRLEDYLRSLVSGTP
jgi:uncharacterized protein YbjT (DUF2867 family)